LDNLWYEIAMRRLANRDALAAHGLTLINGIESDIISVAHSHWLSKLKYRPWIQSCRKSDCVLAKCEAKWPHIVLFSIWRLSIAAT
jgi:hypothetical protein